MIKVKVEGRFSTSIVSLPAVPRVGEHIYINYRWVEVKHVGFIPNEETVYVTIEDR
ncbi:hypothetical protein phiOC_p397 [Ochrobactrum phage vB_OspM_OC]|nr:hypothetical protein phiOC_p397 [Ochrobactrum phage vB_OspM_OC]